METSDDANKEPQGEAPSVSKLKATPQEQVEYFTEDRRKAAVPREIELPDPEKTSDED
ncbi:hypothetical protein [Paeniglutamicibacter psychrophenolicus]|uniref:hypothetical protein n=1 Tax=Paeniglutamicibacter psychrophenolicus TaxID=257454 RepID=UPI0027822A03|nr:hypothetical protein [Paeniglutamicibacter psychrophenolicus]MDQ0093177.1 hypothetical protein [Paeniglutamicibacter psychrophenolicus]